MEVSSIVRDGVLFFASALGLVYYFSKDCRTAQLAEDAGTDLTMAQCALALLAVIRHSLRQLRGNTTQQLIAVMKSKETLRYPLLRSQTKIVRKPIIFMKDSTSSEVW